MQLLCVGDIAILNNLHQHWLPPGGVIPGDENKILFNWELPIGKAINKTPRSSGPRLLSATNSIDVISNWAPGFATLATNHILDGGADGLTKTIYALHQAGFETVGAGLSHDEISKPLIWETNDGRLSIVNWVFQETHPDWGFVPGPNCWPGVLEAKQTIDTLKQETDWVLIVVHWSDELFPFPLRQEREIAHQLGKMGADIIIGHHPHVVRGMEAIGYCPVFYSVGNYFFSDILDGQGGWINREAPRNREGLGIKISFRRGERIEYKLLSFWHKDNKVILDPLHRAVRRSNQVSRPLHLLTESEYEQWYLNKRKYFNKVWCRLLFGFWRLGVAGLWMRLLFCLSRKFRM